MSGSYYSSYVTRPGVLTATGVLSIIIACLSMLLGVAALFFSSIVLQFSGRVAAPPKASVGPPATAVVHPALTEYVAPEGLSTSQRQIVINGLQQVRPITDVRVKQLDGLLADVGQTVIRLSPDSLTADRVASYVTDVRNMPSGSGGPADDLFILGSGRLQLTDHGAVFFPENSPSPIRSGGGSYTDSSGAVHLASTQVAGVVERVKSLSTQPMNDAQVSSLEAQLESPTQTIITPSPSVAEAAAQVTSVQALGDGTIAVTTSNGATSFGSTGTVYQGVVMASAMQGPWGAGGNGPRIQRRDATMLMLDSVLSFAAAGFLLACGIMVLRNARVSRWMYYIYAVGKILLVMLSCYAIYSVAAEMSAGSPDSASTATAWLVIVALPGVIFPVVVLIVMSLRSVREFLGTEVVGRIF